MKPERSEGFMAQARSAGLWAWAPLGVQAFERADGVGWRAGMHRMPEGVA